MSECLSVSHENGKESFDTRAELSNLMSECEASLDKQNPLGLRETLDKNHEAFISTQELFRDLLPEAESELLDSDVFKPIKIKYVDSDIIGGSVTNDPDNPSDVILVLNRKQVDSDSTIANEAWHVFYFRYLSAKSLSPISVSAALDELDFIQSTKVNSKSNRNVRSSTLVNELGSDLSSLYFDKAASIKTVYINRKRPEAWAEYDLIASTFSEALVSSDQIEAMDGVEPITEEDINEAVAIFGEVPNDFFISFYGADAKALAEGGASAKEHLRSVIEASPMARRKRILVETSNGRTAAGIGVNIRAVEPYINQEAMISFYKDRMRQAMNVIAAIES